MLYDLVEKNRSYRRFYEDEKIPEEALIKLVELARLTPSSVNFQPLRYMIITDDERRAKVFETLGWAGLLKDWDGPVPGERPAAYILILLDKSIVKNMMKDVGIVAQTMMLGAVEQGFGGCMLGNIDRPALAASLGIDEEKYSIELCLALGKPKEKVVITGIGADGSTAYYREADGTHCVPKRKTEDLIIN